MTHSILYIIDKDTKVCKFDLTCTMLCTIIMADSTKRRTQMFDGTYIIVQQFVLVKSFVRMRGDFVIMAEYSTFGLVVKTKLLGPPVRTQGWLAKEVSNKTGLVVDDSYLSKILTGQRKPQKVIRAICEILDISDTPTS